MTDATTPESRSDVLDPPGTVLAVGDPLTAAQRDALTEGAVERVLARETPAAATAAWETSDDVACVLVSETLPEGSWTDLCERIGARDEDLPIVLVVEAETRKLLRTAFDVGVTDVVAADLAPSALRARVEDAVTSYAERRRAVEESEVLDGLLDSIGEAIYVKDERGRHVRSADVPGGFDPEFARGKTDVELYGDDDPEGAREAYEDDMRVVEGGDPVFERIERVGDDQDLWMRTTKVPWRDDEGDVRGLLGLTINVTEYKQTERRLEELESRFDDFASQLGHDVKNPLQVASGKLRLALETDDLAPVSAALDAVERAEEVVEDYEALARRGRTERRQAAPVELGRLVEEVWDTIDDEGTELVVTFEDLYVNASEEMVRPILENLLNNAVTHTEEAVTIRVGDTVDGFYVEDTGRGIPEGDREKVLAEGYTTAEDGSGRGLDIVRSKVDEHVWTLSIGESPEGGARFDVGNCRANADVPALGTSHEFDATATVGDPTWGGESEYRAEFDRWVLRSDGVDVYRQDNEFTFVHATVEGPVSVQGRVLNVEYVDDYSKGGLMVRDSLDEDATYAYLGRTPGHGSEVLCREDRGADGYNEAIEDTTFSFDWYRLDRVGDEVSLYVSMDGERWQSVGSKTVTLTDPIHVGMVACSCLPGRPCEVTFERVSAADLETR